MNALFNRWLPAATLALWGGVILWYWGAGRLDALLQGEFKVYAVITAVLLLLGACVVAFSRIEADCCADTSCSHALGRTKVGKLLTFGIILLPLALKPFGSASALREVQGKNRVSTEDFESVAASVKDKFLKERLAGRARDSSPASAGSPEGLIAPGNLSPPPPLILPSKDGDQPPSAAGAANVPAGSQPPAPSPAEKHPAAAEQQSFAEYLQRTPDGTIVAEVLDLLYAAQDNVLRQDFEEKKVQLIVQYMPDTATAGAAKAAGNRFKGVRMFMTCCAADARPIATLIEAEKMPEFPEMTWVKVVGKATFPIERGRRISIVQAEKIEKAEPPPENMLN